MYWVSAAAKHPSIGQALDECIASIRRDFEGRSVDFITVFVAQHFGDDRSLVAGIVSRAFPEAVIAGGSMSGVIGGRQELEDTVGISMCAAHLPDVELSPFLVGSASDISVEKVGVEPELAPALFVMSTPGIDVTGLVQSIGRSYPRSTTVGGVSGTGGNSSQLYYGGRVVSGGALGVALSGDIELSTVVAQGCRPLGGVFEVTRTKRNLLFELNGEPVASVLEDWFGSLNKGDRERFQASPLVGLAVDKGQLGAGDFLMRNVLSLDRATGALAVGAMVDSGQRIQFYVRDSEVARTELRQLLERDAAAAGERKPAGAMLFSCVGRGRSFFGSRGHDSGVFFDTFPESPLCGGFCNGEIGPVRGSTQLHGYSSAFGIFRQKRWD